MKKLLAIFLVLVLMGTFAACAGGGQENPDTPDAPEETPMSEKIVVMLQEGGLGDQGWNDNAWQGIEYCQQTYGIDATHVEATGAADSELFVRELAEEGYGLIIVLDTSIYNQVIEIAPDYPDSTFVILGRYNMYANTGNLVYIQFDLSEHAFLGGAAAAYVATDGQEIVDYAGQNPGVNIGLIFPVESNGFYNYGGGFRHGALLTNPDSNFFIDYSTGFSDIALCQTIAENMIVTNKCDVIWTCCGTSGLGGLQACRINNAMGIGVDTNQDAVEEGYILTSVVRHTDATITEIVEKWMDGSLRGANLSYNPANGGLGLTDFSTIASHVTNEENFEGLKAHVADMTDKIVTGEIVPFTTNASVYAENPEGGGTVVTFEEWWAVNKDTNPYNTGGWTFEEALITD